MKLMKTFVVMALMAFAVAAMPQVHAQTTSDGTSASPDLICTGPGCQGSDPRCDDQPTGVCKTIADHALSKPIHSVQVAETRKVSVPLPGTALACMVSTSAGASDDTSKTGSGGRAVDRRSLV